MKRFVWQWLAVSSLLLAGVAAAETRPQYGGTLHVAMRAAPTSLDPADRAQPDSFARRNLTFLIFETLVTTDASGRVHPGLAVSWQASPGNQPTTLRWQFHLRRGIKFHDGTILTPEIAATSLRTANPSWRVIFDSDSVMIESDASTLDLPTELALPRNAIVKRDPEKQMTGTGPFHIADWQPGKKLSLAAEENYWRGRPFLDGVEIELGRNFHDQLISLELGKADVVEVAPEQAHRVSLDGRRLNSSAPMELIALQFSREAQSPEEKSLREALALSIDRASMKSVLLQGVGQPAASILPNWMSGYAFIFSTSADLPQARHLREQVRNIPSWTLGYDGSDSMARLLAERIALNAKDAGLILRPVVQTSALPSNNVAVPDLRLVRISLASVDPWISLVDVAETTGSPLLKFNGDSVEDLYAAEQKMLASQRLIPMFHLPTVGAAAANLNNWSPHSNGSWNLPDVWLENNKP